MLLTPVGLAEPSGPAGPSRDSISGEVPGAPDQPVGSEPADPPAPKRAAGGGPARPTWRPGVTFGQSHPALVIDKGSTGHTQSAHPDLAKAGTAIRPQPVRQGRRNPVAPNRVAVVVENGGCLAIPAG